MEKLKKKPNDGLTSIFPLEYRGDDSINRGRPSPRSTRRSGRKGLARRSALVGQERVLEELLIAIVDPNDTLNNTATVGINNAGTVVGDYENTVGGADAREGNR